MKLLVIILMVAMLGLLIAAFLRRRTQPGTPTNMVHVPAETNAHAHGAQCDAKTDCGDAN